MPKHKTLSVVGALWGAMIACGCVHAAQGAHRNLSLEQGRANAGQGPCELEIQDLTAELYKRIGACTAVLRLGYERREIRGFQIFCDRYRPVDEAKARECAGLDAGLGKAASLLADPEATGHFLFQELEKSRGTVVAVSGHTGLTVFGGVLELGGGGAIVYPNLWRSSRALGSGCKSNAQGGKIEKQIGYDLIRGTSLAEKEVSVVTEAILDTALPEAFRRGGYVFESVVLLYAPVLGKLDPASSEWIVLLGGGWLE